MQFLVAPRASGSLLSAVKAMHQGLEPGPRPSQRHEEHVRVPSHAVCLDRDDARRARLAHVVVPRAAVCRQPVRESSSSARQALGTTVLRRHFQTPMSAPDPVAHAARCRRGASRPAGGAGRGARFDRALAPRPAHGMRGRRRPRRSRGAGGRAFVRRGAEHDPRGRRGRRRDAPQRLSELGFGRVPAHARAGPRCIGGRRHHPRRPRRRPHYRKTVQMPVAGRRHASSSRAPTTSSAPSEAPRTANSSFGPTPPTSSSPPPSTTPPALTNPPTPPSPSPSPPPPTPYPPTRPSRNSASSRPTPSNPHSNPARAPSAYRTKSPCPATWRR